MALDSQHFQAVIRDQRADLECFMNQTTLIPRDQQADFDVLMKSRLVSVVLGVRRSGKSTLCFQRLNTAEVGYLNFDDERLLGVRAHDLNKIYEVFLQIAPKIRVLVLDEIQNVEGWELFVNRLQRKGLKLVVTGSNGHLLGHELSTHLTGRHLSLELFPFSFVEFLRFHQVTAVKSPTTEQKAALMVKLEEYAAHGGFPEVVQGESPGPYLRELFDRIISRDVLQRRSLKSSKALKELALYLVQNSGGLASYQKLTRLFEFKSVHTLKNYVGFLEETYLIQELLAYSNKLKERFTLPRKIYAIDTGLIRALSTKPTPNRGAELETLLFLQLRRKTRELYYYRTAAFEVDFVVCDNGKPVQLVQSCWSMSEAKTRQRELKALVEGAQALKVVDLVVVTWDEEEDIVEKGRRISVLPLWKFLNSRSETA